MRQKDVQGLTRGNGQQFGLVVEEVADIRNVDPEYKAMLAILLCGAVAQNDLDHVRAMIDSGASMLMPDYDNRWPLHVAASLGHQDMCQLLLACGHPVNVLDRFGSTPLVEAAVHGRLEVAEMLRKAGATEMRSSTRLATFLCGLAATDVSEK